MVGESILYKDIQKLYREDNPVFPDWLNKFRDDAYKKFLEQKFPNKRHEDWKNISLDKLLNADVGNVDELSFSMDDAEIDVLNFQRAVDSEDDLKDYFKHEDDVFKTIGDFTFKDGIFIRFPDGVEKKKPTRLELDLNNKRSYTAMKTIPIIIVMEKNSLGRIVVDIRGNDESNGTIVNLSFHVVVKDGAKLDFVICSNLGKNDILLDYTRVDLHKYSNFNGYYLNSSGTLVRNNVEIDIKEKESDYKLYGLGIATETSEIHSKNIVKFLVEECEGNQLFKNILTDKAKTTFNGKVYVNKGADRTNSDQLNKNLLLSNDSEAYSRPQLMIYADDVKCTHGSTSGALDDKKLFYIKTRGLDDSAAKRLLVDAFAGEILMRVPDDIARVYFSEIVKKIEINI